MIAESCYLLRDIRGAASAFLDNVERGIFQIPYQLAGGVVKLLRKYAHVPIDFADACLVDLASNRQHSDCQD